MIFQDRRDAGRRLADRLRNQVFVDPLVLALPRGGVPVAAEVAAVIGASMSVFVARKIGAPGQPEFGIGAVAEGSDEVVVSSAASRLGIDRDELRALVDDETAEMRRRIDLYRNGRPLPPVRDRDVILVDDGLATGVTAEAALRALRRLHPRRLVLAAPVCSPDTARRLRSIADDVVCLDTPSDLGAIGAWYRDFTQTTDAEVLDLLAESADRA